MYLFATLRSAGLKEIPTEMWLLTNLQTILGKTNRCSIVPIYVQVRDFSYNSLSSLPKEISNRNMISYVFVYLLNTRYV